MAPTLAVLLVLGILITAIPLAIESAGSAYLMVDDTVIVGRVHNNVTVYRDDWGVPHIYAQDTHDAYYALGYVMAQDRLFQMDLFRRAVAGRLAEIFGNLMFKDDVLMRTLGIYQTAVDTWNGLYPDIVIPPDVRENLEMFSAGVNDYVLRLRIPDDVPHEWRILSMASGGLPLTHFIPYPWTPSDSVAIAGMMGLMLGDTSAEEILRGGLVSVDPDLAEFLMPTGWINMTTIMPDPPGEGGGSLGSIGTIEAVTAPLQRLLGFSGLGGSNNWVIDDQNTTTGNTMLANDPHLDLTAPGIWWQVHMNIADYANVIGVCITGGPVIGAGHNDYFAWGPTNFMADVVDMYYYDVRNSTHYWYVNHWEPFTVTYETIYNLTKPVTITVKSTRHGPLINTSLAAPYDKMAFRWSGKEAGYGEIVGFSRLMNATNLAQWRESLSHISVVIQNWVFADKLGNIAWNPAGKIPLRPPPPPNGTGTMGALPSNGSAGQNEWFGWIPQSTNPSQIPYPWNETYSYYDTISLPYAVNPAQGYIATANNQPIDPSYPGYPWPVWISPACGFDPGYRAQRIEEMIESLAPISIDDMKKIQADSLCIPARNIVPILNATMWGDTNATIRNATALLANWNYTELRSMPEPLIWEAFLEKFTDNTFGDEPWAGDLYPFPNTIIPLWNMTQDPSSSYAIALFDDNTTAPVEDMTDIMNKSLHDALDWITSQLGPPGVNFSNWEYGDLHVVNFDHPMGPLLGYFNVPPTGPVGCDGGPYTVDPGGHAHRLIAKGLYVGSGASYRGIYECKNGWNTSLILVPPGESGTVTGAPLSQHFDPHYDDTFPLWLDNQYTTCLFNDTEIQTYQKTIFVPGIPDVAVTNVSPSKTIIGQGYSVSINVNIENQGDLPEIFYVTSYANTTTIQIKTIKLQSGNSTTSTFTWNTSGFAKGVYTISANATPVPDETNITDNTYTYGTVRVGMVGDVLEPFGGVDIFDVAHVAKGYEAELVTNPQNPRYGQYWHLPPAYKTPCPLCPHDPNTDIDGNGEIDIFDVSYAAKNYET